MSESKLKELIFTNDSTTLKTLSDLEVTDIASLSLDISKLKQESIEFKQQLDSLGAKLQLETDKLSNRINDNTTKIEENVDNIITLTDKVTNNDIKYQQEFDDISINLTTLTSKVSQHDLNFMNVFSKLNVLTKTIEMYDEKFDDIQTELDTFNNKIAKFEDSITGLEDYQAILKTSVIPGLQRDIKENKDNLLNLTLRVNQIEPDVENNYKLIQKLNSSVYDFPSPVIRGMGVIDKDTIYESTCSVQSGNDRIVYWYIPVDVADRTLQWNTTYQGKWKGVGDTTWRNADITVYGNTDKMHAGFTKDFMGIPNMYYLTINQDEGAWYMTSYNVTKAIENL